jgi:hypothetical protein
VYAHRDGSECCPSHRTQRVWSVRGRGSRGNGLYYPRAPQLTILTISCLKSKDQRGRGVRRPAGRQYRPLPWCPPAQEIKHTAGGMVENGLYCRRLPTATYRLHSSCQSTRFTLVRTTRRRYSMPAAAGECRDRSHRPAGCPGCMLSIFEYCNHQTLSLLHVDRMQKERSSDYEGAVRRGSPFSMFPTVRDDPRRYGHLRDALYAAADADPTLV